MQTWVTHIHAWVSLKCAEKREREVWNLHSSSHLYASKQTHLHKHSHTHARRETRRGQSFYHWAEVFIYKLNHPDMPLWLPLSQHFTPSSLSLFLSHPQEKWNYSPARQRGQSVWPLLFVFPSSTMYVYVCERVCVNVQERQRVWPLAAHVQQNYADYD